MSPIKIRHSFDHFIPNEDRFDASLKIEKRWIELDRFRVKQATNF